MRRFCIGWLVASLAACGDETTPAAASESDVSAPDSATPEDTAGTSPEADSESDTPIPNGDDIGDPVPKNPFEAEALPLELGASGGGAFRLGPLQAFKGGKNAYAEVFGARAATEVVKFILGFYTFEETGEPWTTSTVSALTPAETADVLLPSKVTLVATKGFGAVAEVIAPNTVALDITVPDGMNRTSVAFRCEPGDHFLGLGAQTPALDHRGKRVPIWVAEQGIGKQTDLDESEFNLGFKGHHYDSYFPVPFFIGVRLDPVTGVSESYGLLVEGTERIVFELCSTNSKGFRIERWAPGMRLIVFSGGTPADVLKTATAYMGRPPLPPDWAHLPWIAVKGGSEVVRAQVKKVEDNAIPASAIWSEDWLGESMNALTGFNIKYHWEWDPEHYPDLPALIAELHAKDLKFLGYFNPFVTQEFKEWQEAVDGGFLPLTPEGEPYEFTVLTDIGSVVDVTNAAARSWLLAYMSTARDLGIDGWMADYGEWVPYDATFSDGRTGASVSSDYPLLWQEINREACAPEDGCVFFVRSGYTGSGALSTAVWGGDQNTDFGEDDGLPTAVRVGIGLGLAGVGFYGSDIAGYTSTGVPPSDKELFWRWTQFGAWSPIMRTHEGNAGPKNWWFDEDAETLAQFKLYAEVHARLYPYLRGLMAEAAETGIPPMRHPALHEPTTVTIAAADSYLLGSRVLVAPVVARGALTRTVGLPPGGWVDLRTGTWFEGDQSVTVDAPLGEIPVFAGEGAVLPQLSQIPLGPSAAAANEAAALTITLVAGRDGTFTLADGTRLSLHSEGGDPGPLDLPTCEADERPCTTVEGSVRTYRLDEGETIGGPTFAFAAEPASGRAIDLVLYVK